ncbi:MAG: DsbC family protein [Desulfuromonadales bacterium]|nr:DsbC family protein [Desulfuromonadales bacterium]
MRLLAGFLIIVLWTVPGVAFQKDGCGAGSCVDCHALEIKEAATLLEKGGVKVRSVEFAEVPGFWVVDATRGDQRFPLYIDFSKKYILAGNVIRLQDGKNITAEWMEDAKEADPPETVTVDFSKISLDDALILGKKDAPVKVAVFTDPLCPYCKRLHEELRKVVAQDPAVAFYIKLFPLKMHGQVARDISIAASCQNSLALLEKGFDLGDLEQEARAEGMSDADKAGLTEKIRTIKELMLQNQCQTDVLERTAAQAVELGIRSTPTLVFPSGEVAPGAKPADRILEMLGRAPAKGNKTK